jgi:fumarate hydratase class I
MASFDLALPISEDEVRALRVGDAVRLTGVVVTGRDAAHKYIVENFVRGPAVPESEQALHKELARALAGGVIYHCGPVVRQEEEGRWQFVAAGPTTSIREEVYEPDVIAHFGLRGVIGKGGMGKATLRACQEHGAVYFHAIGGAATLIADAVKEVLAVHKMAEFGIPEAFWVVRVAAFPVIVTMDAHGHSLHEDVQTSSGEAMMRLLDAAEGAPLPVS